MAEVIIRTYGHACFLLESDGHKTVIDPYANGKVPGLPDLDVQANKVYCSHGHDDHGAAYVIKLIDTDAAAPYTIEEYETSHDDQGGKLRGKNMVRIFRYEDLSIAHLGDIGCEPDEALYKALAGVDCLLIPVGGHYTIDALCARQIIRKVDPKVAVPMHYRTDRSGFGVIAHIDSFTELFDSVNHAENEFRLTKQTEKQILVLDYKP